MDDIGYIEGEDRNQIILMPDCIVDGLNMNKLEFKKAKPASTGRPAYNPRDLLKLYIYGYMNRIRSSRRLEAETHKNLEVMWLIKKLQSDFRKDNKKAIKQVFKEFVLLCENWDLFGKELIAVDGSKFKAWNGKKQNFNQRKLNRKIKEIEEKIEKYIEKLDKSDKIESSDRKVSADEIEEK
ncbi:hypothetical protein U472_11435 [Orenia metallireducens]|uniref:Transposase InsH N-terminal domain-containing protein n=1 Tax=Orenia metallireducens TaxID=1413210 RepID=A0A1C0A8P6_9FIRM|nr:transposase [Orenia metallireducens]OCL26591.1 hypothetical protein U472_11435 [Orenia metallireducens]